MKSLLLALVIAFSSNAVAESIQWLDYKEARALNSDKPIFVFAKMRFCSACIAMEEFEFTDKDVVKTLNNDFIPVKDTTNFMFSRFVFDDLKDEKGDTLKFRGFPSVMVVKGEKYALSQGYKNAEQLKTILAKALQASAIQSDGSVVKNAD